MIKFYNTQKSLGSFLTKRRVFFTESILSNYSVLLFFVFAFFFSQLSFAGNITITSSNASTAPTQRGATKQAIVEVTIYNPNGGGQGNETISGMDFTLANTNNIDVTKAQLWYSASGNFATATQLGADVTVIGATASFTFSHVLPNSNGALYYYWLTYDISATATICTNYVDALQTSAAQITTTATKTFSNTSTANSRLIQGPGCWTYCTAGGSSATVGEISNVTFNTINRNSAFDGYVNTGLTTTVLKTLSYNLSVTKNISNAYDTFTEAWIDWNNDGDFADGGEIVLPSVSSTTIGLETRTISVTVPVGATTGTTRMRVMMKYNTTPTSTGCDTGTIYMDVEDYNINIIPAVACVAPTAQPTVMSLTPAGTSIAGSFTAASPVADNYLVVISTFATPPSAPVSGTTYAIGSSLSSGYIVVDNDSNTTFTASGLNITTTYYLYIYSFNSQCTGGPAYYTTSPLTGNATTTAVVPPYCGGVNPSSTNGSAYISSMRSVGTITDVTNGPTGYSASGYGNYSAVTLATQVAGSGINLEIVLAGSYSNPPCNSNAQFIKTWVDWNKDGDFDDAGEQVYVSGTDVAPVATALDNIYGFIVPAGTFPGNYRMRVRTRAYCDSAVLLPCATGYGSGETEDYTIRVIEDCPSKILTVTNGSACGPTSTVVLNATKTASATGFKWYTSATGATLIATTGSSSWTTPSISATTTYYVTAYDVVCESIHRTPVVATILPTTNITASPSAPQICGENNIVSVSAIGDFVTETLILQDFESGMSPFTVTNPATTNAGADTSWSVKTSPYVPNSTTVWRPAINSGAIGSTGNKFAFTTSDYNASNIETIMTSPSIDATLYTSLSLTYNHIYGAFSGDSGNLEVSVNGGAWSAPLVTYTTDTGTPSAFTSQAFDFSAYAGVGNLRFRFRYTAQWDDGWAVDNIKLEGVRPLNTTFTWSGASVDAYIDLACTIPYVAQSVTTVYIKPTAAQLESGSYSFTANATLGNGCPVSKLITVTNNSKVWKGTISNDWNVAGNWSPSGIPDANTCVIIPTGTTSNIMNTPNALAKNVTVKAPTGVLDLQTGRNLTVTDWINVEAGVDTKFYVRDDANLVQVTNAPSPANSGNIIMERTTNVRLQDYSYWSSPVGNGTNSTITGTFPVGNISVAPGPIMPAGYIFKWETTATNANGGQGDWTNTAENMIVTKGYIARAPSTFTNAAFTPLTGKFTGIPNNGIFSTTIYRGTDFTTPGTQLIPRTATDDNWNLLGNPYPSSIGVKEFLTANPTNITGGVRLWTHGNLPTNATDPFYENFASNYYASDYVAINLAGATSGPGDPSIGAGQGFMVLMAAGAPGSATVTFNNGMRNAIINNSTFYRNGASENATVVEERHRIWLDLVGANGNATRTLIAYVNGATQAQDNLYDSFTDYKNSENFYSLINTEPMQIQGKALPFENTDFVPMGFKTSVSGSQSIAIAAVDGIFSDASQNILIEDKLLNTTHNLKDAPYTFTTAAGIFNDRFVLRYSTTTLSNNDSDANTVKVFTNNSTINVTSTSNVIKEVVVYDVLGKTIINKTDINKQEVSLNELKQTSTMLIVKVTLENNEVIVKKIIF